MSDLLTCLACLATDVKLHSIHKFKLKNAYENLSGIKMPSDTIPQHLCSFCAALLLKCIDFKEKCHRARELFNFTALHHEVVTTAHIRVLNKQSHHLTHPYSIYVTQPYIKDERCSSPEIIDNSYENNHDDFSNIDNFAITDYENIDIKYKTDFNFSSDEEPLNRKVKKKRKLKKIKYKIDSNLSDVELVVLSKEEQIKEIQGRRESLNYQNSLYRCDKCYKGFITEVTYKNHMVRHDMSSGPHECDICLTRWGDARSLRSHCTIAHERKYICRVCGDVSRSLHKAKEHNQWHKGYRFRCKICGATFSKSTSHLTHLRLQHPSGYSCKICGKSFIGQNGLNIHEKKAHRHTEDSKSECVCVSCGTRFNHARALAAHARAAAGAEDVQGAVGMEGGQGAVGGQDAAGVPGCDASGTHRWCAECGARFASEHALREHALAEHRNSALKCHHCDRTFAHERSIAMHLQRVHLGVKTKCRDSRQRIAGGVCEICGAKCTSKASLEHHKRIHTGEKPYACRDCPKRFSVLQRLQIHLRTHTGERPFQCPHCPKAFKHKAALNRHNRVHTGAKPYVCPHCSKSFSQSNSMKLHVRTVHLKMPAPYRSRRNKTSENI